MILTAIDISLIILRSLLLPFMPKSSILVRRAKADADLLNDFKNQVPLYSWESMDHHGMEVSYKYGAGYCPLLFK